MAQDLRFAQRSLRRSWSFTLVAVLTLGLGIGANTAIFSVLDSVVLKPLPFPDPGQLMVPWETFRTRDMTTGTVSYPNLQEWEDRNRVFENIAGLHPEPYTLTGRGIPDRIEGARVTADFFEVLGVGPAQGRLFLPDDDLEGAENVAVVTAGFWNRHFAGAVHRGSEAIVLNHRTHTVVGVLPEGFDFPFLVSDAEVWTPAALDYVSFYHREWPRLFPLARVRTGFSRSDAQQDMERVAAELEALFPETNTEHGANVVGLAEVVSSRAADRLFLIFGAVGLVLFVACLNVANLLLARGMDRERELGVRSALGAGRGRVVRQLLTEGALLTLTGGILGIGLAWAGTRSLVGLLPEGYPRVGEIGVDLRTLAFAGGISALTCMLAALFPAIQASRTEIHKALKVGVRVSASGRARRVRQGLVVAEVAMAVVILVGAGLLVRSFQQMYAVDPGFRPENVLSFRVAKGWSEVHMGERAQLYSDLSNRISEIPGVEAAGAASIAPVTGRFWATFQHDGAEELPRGERPGVRYVSVTPDYFDALGLRVLRGRGFSGAEVREGPGVMVINEAAAQEFWPDEDPLGKRVRPDVDITDADPTLFEVIGVVTSVRDQALDLDPSPAMYVPHTQQTWPSMSFVVRSRLDRASLIPAIRQGVNDRSQEASFSFRELEDAMARASGERRFITLILGVFAALTLLLAAVGVFGVLSYSVTLRTRELGLRRALGAEGPTILVLVTEESGRLLLMGGALGLMVSLFATRLVSTLLFQVGRLDLLTYGLALGLLLGSGVLATLLPGFRASRVSPMVALRAE